MGSDVRSPPRAALPFSNRAQRVRMRIKPACSYFTAISTMLNHAAAATRAAVNHPAQRRGPADGSAVLRLSYHSMFQNKSFFILQPENRPHFPDSVPLRV